MASAFELGDFAYAHRGLWGVGGVVENSIHAFRAAVAAGLGVEFDVRASRDNVPIVFHDAQLTRLTQRTDYLSALSASELRQITLPDGSPIPTLETLLEFWPHHLPLLCEIKIDAGPFPEAFVRNIINQFRRYPGSYAVMSFDTATVKALPVTMRRGQLLTPYSADTSAEHEAQILTAHTHDCDYLACHVGDVHRATVQDWRHHKSLICWTVRSEAECAALSEVVDAQIFEAFPADRAKLLSGAILPA